LRILVTNDDGIDAAGIGALVRAMGGKHDVVVAAPDTNRSASGHSITLGRSISVAAHTVFGAQGFRVGGTPVDAVKLALEQLLDNPPDLVLSGINHGSNLGRDVFYSGTVSAAMEAAFMGVPAVAISLADRGDAGMPAAAAFVDWWLSHAYRPLPAGAFYNINLPPPGRRPPDSIAITRLGERHYMNEWRNEPPRAGRQWFRMAGVADDQREAPDTDVVAVASGKISITPLMIDLTASDLLASLAAGAATAVPPDAFGMAPDVPDTLTRTD
jgi:5'-nucleotidase